MVKTIHRAGRAIKTCNTAGRPRRASQPATAQTKPVGKTRHKSVKKRVNRKIREPRQVSSDKIAAILVAMLRDLRTLNSRYGTADYDRDVETVSRRVDAEGVKFATIHLPGFFEGLLGYLETGKSVYPGFHKLGRQQYPHFLKGLVAPIYASPYSEQSVENMKHLYQFCMAFQKLQGPADPKKCRDQLAEFVEVDISLKDIDFSLETVRDIVRDARDIVTSVFQGADPFDPHQAGEFIPRPGPGATNTPTKHAHRYRPVRWFPELFDTFSPENWFMPPYSPPRKVARNWIEDPLKRTRIGRRARKTGIKIDKTRALTPTSRFKLVPKKFEKWRGICIEENELQWFQQALRFYLYNRMERHPLTRGRVNFTSQLVNRALALLGSMKGQSKATIDMSSASDRIVLRLVRYLFSRLKPLLQAIEACSSREVELPPGTEKWFIGTMPLEKVAPMGSAICFPIMSIVHFALISAILNRCDSIAGHLKRDIHVYGDDIIVPCECVQAIYDYLPLFGMKINTEKSFSHSLFRESCGLHAYNGVDITPSRFKTCLDTKSSPADLAGTLRLEEALYYKGYREVASLLRLDIQNVAQKFGIDYVPTVDTKSRLFGFFRKSEDAPIAEFIKHMRRRWNVEFCEWPRKLGPLTKTQMEAPDYQTWIYLKVPVIVDTFDENSSFLGEEDRYLRYLTQANVWGRHTYDEGYSRNTIFRKRNLEESALGYRS